ncbi:ExbD/TolR family protein [Bilophila wadsworthia]
MSITPLVDVVFLLLLFFALTLHFSPEEAISVELPTSSSAKQQSETEIILTVTPEGVIRLNGNVPSQSLETELASLRKIDEKQAVQVRADQEVEVGKLVAIIDAIRNAGFQYFDLMTQQVNRK